MKTKERIDSILMDLKKLAERKSNESFSHVGGLCAYVSR